jgi:hypothetical protein
MSEVKGAAQSLDINAIGLNATHNEMADIAKLLASRAGNHVGTLARTLAEKALLEERVKTLEAEIAGLRKAAGRDAGAGVWTPDVPPETPSTPPPPKKP